MILEKLRGASGYEMLLESACELLAAAPCKEARARLVFTPKGAKGSQKENHKLYSPGWTHANKHSNVSQKIGACRKQVSRVVRLVYELS